MGTDHREYQEEGVEDLIFFARHPQHVPTSHEERVKLIWLICSVILSRDSRSSQIIAGVLDAPYDFLQKTRYRN